MINSPTLAILHILPWLATVAGTALMIWAIVDAVRNGRYFWIWIIIFFPPFGALIYLFVERGDLIGGAAEHWLRLGERKRIAELRNQIAVLDAPHHHAALGDALLKMGRASEAVNSYRTSVEGDPDDPDARAGLGYALRATGRYKEAADVLGEVAALEPRHNYGRTLLEWAGALRETGNVQGAVEAYDRLLESFTYSEARYQRALLLAGQGKTEEARQEMERIVREGKILPRFARPRERPWVRRARVYLAGHGKR